MAVGALGWLDVSDATMGLTVAVEDFWQNYPKAFTLSPEGVDIGLCPDFDAGLLFDAGVWFERTPEQAGSWWPAWHAWLAQRSGSPVQPPPMGGPKGETLGAAPGTFVLMR